MKRLVLNLTIVVMWLFLAPGLSAATKADGQIRGKITDAATGEVLQFATVAASPSNSFATTDANGEYLLKNIPDGKAKLQIQFFGMETVDTTVTVKPGQGK